MSLRLGNIRFTYGREQGYAVRALDGVSLVLEPGQLALVVGVTGSGKSTLLRIAAGLLAADSGDATIDGEPLTAQSARGRVGLVFQDPESQLFADTLLEDVAFGPRNLGRSEADARTDATSALAAVGLDPDAFAGRSPFSLSGGEARRAAIAGVLAMRPDYLLADEPTAGLDARGRQAVRDLILEQRRSAGVLVVSHAAGEFLADADLLVVLAGGAVAWSGPASEAVAHPERLAAFMRLPDVLEVQRLARARGFELPTLSLVARVAAEGLAEASRRGGV